MAESVDDRIPSLAKCDDLMVQYAMLPNIVEHSRQVMHVAVAITDNLKSGASVNRDLVIAAALLHDITKTRSLETKEPHDTSGGALLRKLGFPSTAAIVERHVIIQNLNLEGRLEEWEIVCYADKRVLHNTIVTIEERVHDLVQRYGATEQIRSHIRQSKMKMLALERKIIGFMATDLDRALQASKGLA